MKFFVTLFNTPYKRTQYIKFLNECTSLKILNSIYFYIRICISTYFMKQEIFSYYNEQTYFDV